MSPSFYPAFLTLIAGLAIAGYFLLRPRMIHWGATPSEVSLPLAGDDLIQDPSVVTTRSISIKAPPSRVWPWLVQMGQGRGGFYSYDWLENVAGLDIHNSDEIIPEFQDLKAGDLIPFWRGAGVTVTTLVPNELMLLAGTLNPSRRPATTQAAVQVGGTWVFAVRQQEAGTCRLVVRSRVAKFPPQWISKLFIRMLLEPAHFIMERRMMYGIRDRAESHHHSKTFHAGGL